LGDAALSHCPVLGVSIFLNKSSEGNEEI
jgi:hypothetical protein